MIGPTTDLAQAEGPLDNINSSTKKVRTLVISVILGISIGMTHCKVCCASTTYYAIDPHAHRLLAQMQNSYNELKSLSEQVVAQESTELPDPLVVHTSLAMQRNGELSVVSDSKSSRTGASEVISDGSYCYVTAPQYPARYLRFPVTPNTKALDAALSEGILSSLTLALFADPDTASTMFADSNLATMQVAHPTAVDGLAVNVIVVTDRNGVTITLDLGARDHLLRKVTVVTPDRPGAFTETYTSVVPNTNLPQSDFVFVPPPNMAAYHARAFDVSQDPG